MSFLCPICMEDKESHSFVKCILPCSHFFCLQCVTSFEATHCPLCRHAFSAGNGLNGKCLSLIRQAVKEHAEEAFQERQSLLEAQFNEEVDLNALFPPLPSPLFNHLNRRSRSPPRLRRVRRSRTRRASRRFGDVDLSIEHLNSPEQLL